MRKQVLGVKIDDVSLDEATKIVEGWLAEPAPLRRRGKKHYIVTPNPEFIVTAQSDPEFMKILNSADLSIPDGRGLKIGTDIVCNTPGIDLMESLVKIAAEKGYTVGFLGGRNLVAEETAECLSKKYKNLKVIFADSGDEIDKDRRNKKSHNTKYIIPNTDLLFVAFGAPKQEKWISANLDKIPVKVAMGVGGAFDYISGRVPRAPKWIQDLSLEWLFRLIVQPWRIKRQLSLLKYLWLVMVN